MTDPQKRSSDLTLVSEVTAEDLMIIGRNGGFYGAAFARFMAFLLDELDVGTGTVTTSATSLSLTDAADRVFTDIPLNLGFITGMRVRAAHTADPINFWMEGTIVSYIGQNLTVTMDDKNGVGTFADWSIGVAGVPGEDGADGLGTGDFSSNTAVSVDSESVIFSGTGGKTGKRSTLTANLVKSASGVRSAAAASDIDTTYALGTWKADYINGTGTGVRTALALGADKTLYASNGAAAAPSFRTLANLGAVEFAVTANFTVGYTATSFSAGTKSSGTFTPDPALGNFQHYTNGGAHTLAPPTSVCTMIVECTNASAGALTTSGFSIVDGDTFSSTGTKKHIFYITKTNSFSRLTIAYVTGT